jgi:hypothetical protein
VKPGNPVNQRSLLEKFEPSETLNAYEIVTHACVLRPYVPDASGCWTDLVQSQEIKWIDSLEEVLYFLWAPGVEDPHKHGVKN